MPKFTFALPSSVFDYDVKKFSKQVKTLKFCRQYKTQLERTAERLCTSNCDLVQVIGGMLQIAYGVNIGGQVEALLSEGDFIKIRANIIRIVYE